MPIVYSDIIAPREATPPRTVDGEKAGAHPRALVFSAAVPTGTTAGDDIVLCELPEGALIVGGFVANTAITGITAARLRTETSATAFQTADVSLATAAVFRIETVPQGHGYRVSRFDVDASTPGGLRYAKERVVFRVVTGTSTAAGTINGTIYFTA